MDILSRIPSERPVLIAGPTASGKSALALALAVRDGRTIINADALQVFDNWRVLTARPSDDDERRAAHALYGHVAGTDTYSVGAWLRDLEPLLSPTGAPGVVIVGGTGLYLTALTEGLAEIPPVPTEIREEVARDLQKGGLAQLVSALDAETRARIDTANPARVQRAAEVLRATGQGLSHWHARPAPPLLALEDSHPIVIDAPKDWLNPRIAARFTQMLEHGALDECRAAMDGWTPTRQSAKAIGAPELVAHLRGDMSLSAATEAAILATRQYAKRQRNWFRARMRNWHVLAGADLPTG